MIVVAVVILVLVKFVVVLVTGIQFTILCAVTSCRGVILAVLAIVSIAIILSIRLPFMALVLYLYLEFPHLEMLSIVLR